MRQHQGFTLIELLVVVAIIGIISAISVPNLLDAMDRARISRTKADLKAISTALEIYRLDYNFVPSHSTLVTIGEISELTEYYQGATYDGWDQPLYYLSDDRGQNYFVASTGTDKAWDGFAGPPDWDTPGNFRSLKCQHISFDNTRELMQNGCDLKFVNGGPLY